MSDPFKASNVLPRSPSRESRHPRDTDPGADPTDVSKSQATSASEDEATTDKKHEETGKHSTPVMSKKRARQHDSPGGSPGTVEAEEKIPKHLRPYFSKTTKKTKLLSVQTNDPPRNFEDSLNKIKDSVRNLNELMTKHSNTQLDIKSAVVRLDIAVLWLEREHKKRETSTADPEEWKNVEDRLTGQVNQLTTDLEEARRHNDLLLSKHEALESRLEKAQQGTPTNEVGTLTDNTDNKEVDSVLCRRCNRQVEAEQLEEIKAAKLAKEIEEALKQAKTTDDWLRLISREWPEAAFKRSKLGRKGIVAPRAARSLLITQGSDKDKALLEQLAAQFPSATAVQNLPVGSVVVLRSSEDFELVESSEEFQSPSNSVRSLTVGMLGQEQNGIAFLETLNKVVAKSNSLAKEEPTTLHISEEWESPDIRKAVEICCKQNSCEAEIASRKGLKPPRARSSSRTGERNSEQANTFHSTVRIKAKDGEKFTDVLQTISDHVKPGLAGVKMGKVRPVGENGDLLIAVSGPTQTSGTTFADMIRKGAGVQVDIRNSAGPSTTVVLHNVDPFLGSRLGPELCSVLRLPDDTEIRAEERAWLGKNQVWKRRVTLPHAQAKKLIAMKAVKLGTMVCKPEEWVNVPTCYNCQKLGHLSRECKEKKVEGQRCYKCGDVGHISKKCEATIQKCYACNEEGHVANSMACPKFKEMVQTRRKPTDAAGQHPEQQRKQKEKKQAVVTEDGFTHPKNTRKALSGADASSN